MLYSCTHMVTVGFKGLRHSQLTLIHCSMSCRQHENWSTSLTDNKGLDLAVVSVLVDFLADRTNGRPYATVLRLPVDVVVVVCDVMYCG